MKIIEEESLESGNLEFKINLVELICEIIPEMADIILEILIPTFDQNEKFIKIYRARVIQGKFVISSKSWVCPFKVRGLLSKIEDNSIEID